MENMGKRTAKNFKLVPVEARYLFRGGTELDDEDFVGMLVVER